MDRLFGRRVVLVSRLASLSFCWCSITAVAVLFLFSTQVTADSAAVVVEKKNGVEFASIGDELGFSRSRLNSFKAVDEGNVMFGVVRSISCRVFQFADEQPPQESWPELRLGWRTVSAVIFGAIGAALSSAGGLGGGGLFVPLFNLLLQFDAKTSAALSNFMILGGSVANLWINLRQHHPHAPHIPLIDFDVVLLLQPNMLLGISTGVILNVILPDWAITGLLTVTLGYMTIHSFKGAIRRWKKETSQNRRRKIAAAAELDAADDEKNAGAVPYVPAPDFHHHHSDSAENSSSSSSSSDDDEISPRSATADTRTDPSLIVSAVVDKEEVEENNNQKSSSKSHHSSSLKVPLENASEVEAGELTLPLLQPKESSQGHKFPVDKGLALGFTWLAFFLIQVLRGSSSNESILGIQACGLGYWLLTLFQIPLALSITSWTIRRLRAAHAASILVISNQAGDGTEVVQQLEDGFVLTPESCTLLAWMALIAGLLGGLLGIGGGMIVNPLLLTVGMIPQVTAGTCASMVFFSSSMSVVQYWLMGRVPLDYALSAAALCAISSSVGVVLVHRAIDKYNRASIIVFSVTAVMGVSAILMGGFGGFAVWEKYLSGDYMGFHNFC